MLRQWNWKNLSGFLSLLVFSATLLLPFHLAAQECEYLPKDKGGDRYIKIDGEVHYYLPKEKSGKLLSDLQMKELSEKEVEILTLKANILESIVESQGRTINRLHEEVVFMNDHYQKMVEVQEPDFWENPYILFGASVLLIGGMYGYWSYMGGNSPDNPNS